MKRDLIAKILSIGPWGRRASLAGLGATLLPSLSFGLGLGEIQVESHLNQALYARVEVVDVSDDDWSQIRARVAARTLLSEGSLHPEILASVTLRAVEDSKGRHFLEVKSGEVLTEPLFDLPVEVAGQSLQVVRNYSVLLDPATSEDVPRGAAATVAAQVGDAGQLAASAQHVAIEQVDAQARAARRHPARGARRHSHESPQLANAASPLDTSNSASAPRALDPDAALPTRTTALDAVKASGHEQLEGQLATLQQTLTKMQATIASQDAEIGKLTAQVASPGESQSRRPSTWVEYPARQVQASPDEAGDARFGWFSSHSVVLYWIGGVSGGIAVLAFGVVGFLRWRHARMLREIALNEAARRRPPPKPAVAPTSERDLLAWQSNLRAAQSGKWKPSLEDTFDPTSEAPDAVSRGESALSVPSSGQPAAASTSVPTASLPASASGSSADSATSASEDTVAVTVAVEELTQDLEADLESLVASYEAEHLETATGGMAAWRRQNEMLERDYLSDVEALPYVMETANQAKTIDSEPNLPAVGRSTAAPAELATHIVAAGTRNREVAEILEQSLDFDPDQVDIQLKLLEIYHHEALGNRNNFDSLLRKLEAVSQQLSPAQQRHVEMLQRTLRAGKHDIDNSDFIADVAV